VKAERGSQSENIIELRCSPYHENSSFHPIIEFFERTLSLTPEGQALKVAFALRDVPQTVSDTTLADGALTVTLSLDTPAGQLAAALTLTRSDGKTLFLLDAGISKGGPCLRIVLCHSGNKALQKTRTVFCYVIPNSVFA